MVVGDGLTTTQKGTATEHLVAASLLIASDGRLSPFVPLSDDHGIDLISFDKVTRRCLSLQIKSAIAHPERTTVQFDVRKQAYQPAPDLFLLAVLFDPATVAIGVAWLVPMVDLPSVSVEQSGKFAMTPSVLPDARDRCRRYRHEGPRELVENLLRVLAE